SPPFNEGTVAQKLIWHQTRQPKPIKSIRTDVPDGVAQIIDRMMTKDRAKRYQTPAQVVDALAPWTAKPIQTPPEAWMPRLSPPARGGLGEGSSNVAASPPPRGGLPHAHPRPAAATPAPNRAPAARPAPQPVRQPVGAPQRAAVQPAAQQRAAVQP